MKVLHISHLGLLSCLIHMHSVVYDFSLIFISGFISCLFLNIRKKISVDAVRISSFFLWLGCGSAFIDSYLFIQFFMIAVFFVFPFFCSSCACPWLKKRWILILNFYIISDSEGSVFIIHPCSCSWMSLFFWLCVGWQIHPRQIFHRFRHGTLLVNGC